MATYRGLDGSYYHSKETKEAADGRFMQQQARQQSKEQQRIANQQMQQQRELAAQQLAAQQIIANRQLAEQRQIAEQQVAEHQRIAEQQARIERDRQQHEEKMRVFSLFDAAGINHAIYENFSKYLFVYEAPEHHPPELVELTNRYNELDARYCEASKLSHELDEFNATIQAINSVPLLKSSKVQPLANGGSDSLINDANHFMRKESNASFKGLLKGLLIFEVALFAVMAILPHVTPRTFDIEPILSPFMLITPIVAILAAVLIRIFRRRNKKTKLLAYLHIRANALHQQIIALAGVNTPDIGHAIGTLIEQRNLISDEMTSLERELIKNRWADFHEFRLNNYNPTIEKLLLDMNIPAQLKEHNVGFSGVSKNTANRNNDDIQDYTVYFQEVTT